MFGWSRSCETASARSVEPDAPEPGSTEPVVGLERGVDAQGGAGRAGAGLEERAAVRRVDGGRQGAGDAVERGEVAVERAAGLGGVEQAAETAAGRPGVRGGRAGPRGVDAGDDRVGRAGRELVHEADVDRAVGLGVDRHLPELRQLVEQLVAAVEKVVRHVAGGDEALDHVVELGDLVSDLRDLATRVAGAGGAGEVRVLRVGLGLR